MKNEKSIPALICNQCLQFLEKVEHFKLQCLEANKFFQRIHETNRDNESNDTSKLIPEDSTKRSNDSMNKRKLKHRYKPICGFCGKEQESEHKLRQHELLSHTSLSELSPNEVFICDLCNRIFKTKQSLRNHFVRSHTPKTEVFPCSICGKVLQHLKALYAHERIHVKTIETCQYCSKTFNRRVLLSSHIAIVHLKKRL